MFFHGCVATIFQACRLRDVGDWLLPCQERFERLDEELGERLRGHPGILGEAAPVNCASFKRGGDSNKKWDDL